MGEETFMEELMIKIQVYESDEKHMEGVWASHGGGIGILIVYKHFY